MPRPLKILIADDTPINIKPVEIVARKLGHEVIEAADGVQAVERYREASPDLVIMDIMMPRMDGLEAVRQIRALPADRWVPILFYSALDSVDDIINGLSMGADDYITKPANLQLIRAKLQVYARILELQDAVYAQKVELAAWRAQAEAQNALGRHVMERLIDAKGLADPMLRWVNLPAQTFSGDLLCAARTPDDVLYVMLADATGHGLASALSALPLTQVFYGMTAKGFPLPSLVTELNRKLKQLLPADRFVAATLAGIDVRGQTIEVWNGGNPKAILIDDQGAILRQFASNHLPLGVLPPELFSQRTEVLHFHSPCELILFSDGVLEAENPAGERLGYGGVLRLISGAPAGVRFEHLYVGVIDHMDAAEGHDDVSILAVNIPLEARQTPRLSSAVHSVSPQRVSEWQMALSWGIEELRSLDVVPAVLGLMAQIHALAGHQGALFIILSELFNNALDHGLLGLDSAIKSQENGYELYLAERNSRLARLSSGRIDMDFHLHIADDHPVLDITFADSGTGFDYQRYLAERLETGRALPPQVHGRGIMLVRALCESLVYSERGNRVTARYAL